MKRLRILQSVAIVLTLLLSIATAPAQTYLDSTGTYSTPPTGSGGTAGSPLFVQTASASAVTGNSETTIIGSGVGSLTIPAAWYTSAGTVLDVRFSGKYSSAAVPGTLQLKLKFGSTVVAQTAAFTPIVSVTDGVYSGFIRLVARTVGGSGTIFVADGLLTTGATITPGEVIFANPTLGTAVTIDTTATQTVDLTATWSLAATNSITGYTFEMVGPGSAVSSVFGRTGAVVAVAGDYGPTKGGTGLTSYTQGDILYASAADTLAKLAKNTSADRLLCNTGTSNNPAWCQADVTKAITGILPVANGGTNNALGPRFDLVSGGSTTSQTADFYLMMLGGGGSNATETNLNGAYGIPTAMTCDTLYAKVTTAPGTGNSWIVTVRKGAAIGSMSNTSLTCTMSNTTFCTLAATPVSFAAGDVVTAFYDANTTVTGSGGEHVSLSCYHTN